MLNNSPNANQLVTGHVPKNVSKYPIEQTYLTSEKGAASSTGWRFKMPEVWTSARSGKKSIGIRKIEWIPKREFLKFKMIIQNQTSLAENSFLYYKIIPERNSITDILDDIQNTFQSWATTSNLNIILGIDYNESILTIDVFSASDETSYKIKIVKDTATGAGASITTPSESFNRIMNQPLTTLFEFSEQLTYKNVWDRNSLLHFHSSFIPFDTYQYLGALSDTWQNPIIYQDPNASPLFNVWATKDLKNPFPILHETFIIRMTFIISSDDHYA